MSVVDRAVAAVGDVARFDGDQKIPPRAIADNTALIVLAPSAEA